MGACQHARHVNVTLGTSRGRLGVIPGPSWDEEGERVLRIYIYIYIYIYMYMYVYIYIMLVRRTFGASRFRWARAYNAPSI